MINWEQKSNFKANRAFILLQFQTKLDTASGMLILIKMKNSFQTIPLKQLITKNVKGIFSLGPIMASEIQPWTNNGIRV